jgi:hypothetical protein
MLGRRALIGLLLASACSRSSPQRAPDAVPAPLDAAPVARAAPDAAPPHTYTGKHLAVLYTTSVLGEYDAIPLGGLARRATLAAAARATADGLVHLDAGDTLWPRLVPCGLGTCPAGITAEPILAAPKPKPPDREELQRRGKLLLAGLARAGVQAMAPGETDLALGPAWLKSEARKAGLALLAANVSERGKPWPADRLLDAGVPVGVFGLLTLGPEELAAAGKEGLTIGDPVKAAAAAVTSLRARGARVVIGLWHLAGGSEEARRIAREAPVDLAILGHGGETLDAAEGATRLLAAHDRGTHLGRADLDVTDTIAAFENRLVRVEPKTEAEPQIAAAVKAYVAETRRRLDAKLVTLSVAQPPPVPPPKVWTQPAETWTYGSNAACNLCHPPVMEQWKTTAHAYGLQTLESRGRQRDPYCLACHATGFLQPGGTKNLETALTYFTDVGCESCHGPSVEHVRSQKGMRTVRNMPESVCRGCHRPDQQAEPFDYKDALARILGPAHGKPPR